jgi:hypothetical protein
VSGDVRGASLDEIKRLLTERLEELAEHLLGPPSRVSQHRNDWHFPHRGGAYLAVRGSKRGAFHCFSGGASGGPLDLIMFARSYDFAAAVTFARSWLGLDSDAPAPVDCATQLANMQRRVVEEAEAEAGERKRINTARGLWEQSIAVTGTIADRYLTETRRIPATTDGWPHNTVRFHPSSCALIVATTTHDCEVQAVQRVYLTVDARKIDKAEAVARGLPGAKQTAGVMRNAAVRLPGPTDGPLLLAEGPETGLSAWIATGAETWIALGGFTNLPPLPAGRVVVRCSDDDKTSKQGKTSEDKLAADLLRWSGSGAEIRIAWPWPQRRRDGSDFNDVIKAGGAEAVRLRIAAAERIEPPKPHYSRPFLSADKASRRLRRVVSAFLDRLERYLAVQDWIAAEAERTEDDACRISEARILAKLIRNGADADDAADLAKERAAKVAPRIARGAARRAAAKRFGARAAAGVMPRLQIKGAASLGKTQAVIDEYLRRPALWKRHINVYVQTAVLASDFARDLAAQCRDIAAAPDGSRPRALIISGRRDGLCHPDRLSLIKAAVGKVGSIYRSFCRTPATDKEAGSECEHYAECAYIAQFDDRAPALRLMAHQHLALRQPNDLRLPAPDLVIVDESVVSTMCTHAAVDPALFTDAASYTSGAGEEHLIQEAIEVGGSIAAALTGAEPVAVLRAAGVKPACG